MCDRDRVAEKSSLSLCQAKVIKGTSMKQNLFELSTIPVFVEEEGGGGNQFIDRYGSASIKATKGLAITQLRTDSLG